MAAPSFKTAQELLSSFTFERVLSADPRSNTVCVLGTAQPSNEAERAPAIIRLVKSPFTASDVEKLLVDNALEKTELVLSNAEYSTILAWQGVGAVERGADLQLYGICPATDKHVRKYSEQASQMFVETPEVYRTVVEPYIQSIPARAIDWLYRILDGTAEAENVIHRDEDPHSGFVVTPDLKWDQKTASSIYLLVMPLDRLIRSIRDLRSEHLVLLKKIRSDTERVARHKYEIEAGQLRLFVHYQPTYYHFHVHVTHISNVGFGSTIGQAHLLDEIIDNLSVFPTYYESKTFHYSLGTEHGLYNSLATVATSSVSSGEAAPL